MPFVEAMRLLATNPPYVLQCFCYATLAGPPPPPSPPLTSGMARYLLPEVRGTKGRSLTPAARAAGRRVLRNSGVPDNGPGSGGI